MKRNVYLCSFADSRMSETLGRVHKQAESSFFFEDIFLYDEHSLDDSFKKKFSNQLVKGSRGFGYWVWKPYIVLETLKKIPDDAVLLYMDAGCHINSDGRELFENLVDKVSISSSCLLVPELGEDCLERYYTKGDLLDFFNIRDLKKFVDTPQRAATAFFIKKSEKSVEFIKLWLAVFSNFNLVDDSISFSSNLDGFVENRHDQSVFSILTKLQQTDLFSAELLQKDIQNPLWALRDKKIKFRYRYSLKRFLRKIKLKVCKL